MNQLMRAVFATLHLNGEPAGRILKIEDHVETTLVTSLTPEPDPSWEGVDTQGHLHGWNAEQHHPTSTRLAHGDPWHCADCRESHRDSWWECVECGEQIIPATREPHPERIITQRSITLNVAIEPGFEPTKERYDAEIRSSTEGTLGTAVFIDRDRNHPMTGDEIIHIFRFSPQ